MHLADGNYLERGFSSIPQIKSYIPVISADSFASDFAL